MDSQFFVGSNGLTLTLVDGKTQGYEDVQKWEFRPVWIHENRELVRFLRVLGKPENPHAYDRLCEISLPLEGAWPALYFLKEDENFLYFLNFQGCSDTATYRKWILKKEKIGQRCPIRLEESCGWGGGDRYSIEYHKYFITWNGSLDFPEVELIDRNESETETWGKRAHLGD